MISALVTIATSLGLTRLINSLDNFQAKKNKVSSDDILKLIDQAIDEAKSKGSVTLNKLYDKLNNTTAFGATGVVKSHIQKERNKIKSMYDEAQEKFSNLNTKSDSLKNRAFNLANASPDYRSSSIGQQEVKGIEEEAKELATQYKQGAEKYVI